MQEPEDAVTTYDIDLQSAKAILQRRVPVFAGSLRKAIYEWNSDLVRITRSLISLLGVCSSISFGMRIPPKRFAEMRAFH